MNPGSVLSAMPGATPVPGLESAWRWSPNPVFTLTAALSTDGEHNLQVNVRAPTTRDSSRRCSPTRVRTTASSSGRGGP